MSDERPDDQPMSIGEHLEDLRRHVLKAVGWVVLALIVCLAFQNQLMWLAKLPHQRMVDSLAEEARGRDARTRLATDRVQAATDAVKRDDALARKLDEAERARLIARERARPTSPEALEALERRQAAAHLRLEALQRAFDALPAGAGAPDAGGPEAEGAGVLARLEADLAAARADVEAVRAEVARDVRPLLDEHAQVPKAELQSLNPTDVFLTYIKLALVAALFVAAPLIVWELWKFVSRALYPHERKWVRLFGPLTYGAFLSGFLFGYLLLIPIGLRFLASYAPADVAVAQYSIQGYMSLLITLSLVCGVIFELPLFMTFLALIGVVSAQNFRDYRRYCLLLAFIIAGILTPPDPVTQSLLAIPLLGLYELGIFLAALVGRREEPPPPPPADEEPALEDRYPETPLDDPPPGPQPAEDEEPLGDDPEPPADGTSPDASSPDASSSDPSSPDPPGLGLGPRPAPEGTVPVGAPEPDAPDAPASSEDPEGKLPA
ncbi:MAG: twin-arginine translocase subunit TatC [Planctomycetes bacterium]|nr:twin-arginine translocase subunit TatC [Planctomycetota bacterium]